MPFSAFILFALLAQISGGEFTYTTLPGDTLTSISARFGVDVHVIAETNELKATARLPVGVSLQIDNRHIAPESGGMNIVINVPQRILFYYRSGAVLRHYPVAVGRPGWRTPIAAFAVATKEQDPVWDVPVSIQEEMRRQGKPVVTHVPASPSNPLGKYWIGLSLPSVGIHGTNAPASIYSSQTHGCIRLHPDDIQDLFSLVNVGDAGRIIYESVLMAKAGDAIFLEVHPDVYKKVAHPLQKVHEIADTAGFSENIDWKVVEGVIRKCEGIARNITSP